MMYDHVGNEACHAELASSSHLNYTKLLAPSTEINDRDHKTATASVTDNLKLMLFSLMQRGGAHNHLCFLLATGTYLDQSDLLARF